jgi:hypothetical protein
MRRFWNFMASLSAAFAVTACGGGGGNSGTSPFNGGDGGGSTPIITASTIEMLSSSPQLGTGTDTVTITAVVKDANNVSVASAPVAFATDSGTLSSVSTTTNAAGVATATLSPGADKSNRAAKVTATSGAIVGTIDVTVTGTKLTFSGETTLALNDTPTFSVKAVDSSGNPIANLPVQVTSSLGNGLSASSINTNSQGNASIVYSATKSGSDHVEFASTGIVPAGQTIVISGEDFKFVSPAAEATFNVSTLQAPNPQPLTVQYLKNGVAQVGVTINFAATAGQLSAASAVTNSLGRAVVNISSSTAASATVQATLTGAIVAAATLPIQFVATVPAVLVLQPAETAIGPNAPGSVVQRTKVQARVVDANANPVANQVVNFSRDVDPSGGTLSQPSAPTDVNGIASVDYISGPQSTANNGVQLRATVAGTNVSGTASLTVNRTALFIALGTGNVISNLDPQTYKKDWVVYVTDSNGVAVSGVTLTVRVLPQSYGKGTLVFAGSIWTPDAQSVLCPSEDGYIDGISVAPQNGVLDPGEDRDGNGSLQPGNVISVTPGTLQTDSSGRATVSLIYAESYVPWVDVQLSVTAIVAGTESRTFANFTVEGLAGDFTNAQVPPAGVQSPFGVNTCTTPN